MFKLVALFAGLALLVWVATNADFSAVLHAVPRIGWQGALAIVGAFALGFTADVGAWALMFATVDATWSWVGRLWPVQMVGEAVNTLLPFGSLGGEPVKAVLLKRRDGISYREASGALLLIQAVNTSAEVPFVVIGLVVALRRHILSPTLETAMIVGVAVLVNFIFWLFVALHRRWLVWLQQRLRAGRWGARLRHGLDVLGDIETHLYTFVRHRPLKFAAALAFAFVNWMFGAFELFLILRFLGAPVSVGDAWLMETAVVMVRNVTFFIPGHLGTQDGIITLMGGLLTGAPGIGLAVAVIRRARELLWSGVGLGIGAGFGLGSLTPLTDDAPPSGTA